MDTDKILTGLSRFVSAVFSPILMPTYGTLLVLWTSVLCSMSNGYRVSLVMVVMGITCVLPITAIGALHHFGFINDQHLAKSSERHLPYIFAIVCYIAVCFYLTYNHEPMWFTMFGVGGLAALIITTIVNFKWKISAHMCGMGGLVALVYQIHVQGLSAFEFFWLMCAMFLLAGIVGTARLILKSHTVLQVLLGFVNGYACVTIAMKILE